MNLILFSKTNFVINVGVTAIRVQPCGKHVLYHKVHNIMSKQTLQLDALCGVNGDEKPPGTRRMWVSETKLIKSASCKNDECYINYVSFTKRTKESIFLFGRNVSLSLSFYER